MYNAQVSNQIEENKKVSFITRPIAADLVPSPFQGEFLQIYSLIKFPGPTALFPDHLSDGTSLEMFDKSHLRICDSLSVVILISQFRRVLV